MFDGYVSCLNGPSQRLFSLCVLAAQRSAHELPLVEKQDMDGCSVLGGQLMILTGQNFSADSKVVFMEKTQGGPTPHCRLLDASARS